jgi:hypothetical protein
MSYKNAVAKSQQQHSEVTFTVRVRDKFGLPGQVIDVWHNTFAGQIIVDGTWVLPDGPTADTVCEVETTLLTCFESWLTHRYGLQAVLPL